MTPLLLDYSDVRGQIRDLDVLAFQGRGLVSRGIRLFTGGRVTHVGLAVWVGPRLMLLESREGRGARLVWLSRELERGGVLWLRPRTPLVQPDVEKALDWALRAAGSGYSWRGVFRFVWRKLGLPLAAEDSLAYGNRFCSELVAAVYARLGIGLAAGKRHSETSPADVAAAEGLETVGLLEVVPGG